MARDSQMHCLDKRYDHNFSLTGTDIVKGSSLEIYKSSNVFQS